MKKMCVQEGCRSSGVQTYIATCLACGGATERWDPERASVLERTQGIGLPVAPDTHQEPEPIRVLVVTTNEIAGYRIAVVHGDVFGLTVRTRHVFSNVGASFRTLVGGEAAGYTKLLAASRNEARARLMDEAAKVGANAVVAMRFDCNEIGDIMTEIAAYGTAVTVVADPAVNTINPLAESDSVGV